MTRISISIRIYNYLLQAGNEQTTSEIVEGLGLERRQVMSRLTELHDAGKIDRVPMSQTGYKKNLWKARADIETTQPAKYGIKEIILELLQDRGSCTVREIVQATQRLETSIRGVLLRMTAKGQLQLIESAQGGKQCYRVNPDFLPSVALGRAPIPSRVPDAPPGG